MAHQLSPEIQSFGREVRRLFRHPLVRPVAGVGSLRLDTTFFLRICMYKPRRPAFILDDILKFVRSTQRRVDRGIGPLPTFYDKYFNLLVHATALMSGLFSGQSEHIEPGTECCICLSQHGGDWWYAKHCMHAFHTNCIAAHMWHDQRCPLCRAWLGHWLEVA